MTLQSIAPLAVGQVLEISFPTFTPRITVRSPRELTVEIVGGDSVGFSDTVEYEAVPGSRRLGDAYLAGTHRKHNRARA
jgi:hypothetical protein